MFRNQCEETVKGTGCTVRGVCGKEDDMAAYQDVLVRQYGNRPTTTVQADMTCMVKVSIHDPFYAGLLNSHRTTRRASWNTNPNHWKFQESRIRNAKNSREKCWN